MKHHDLRRRLLLAGAALFLVVGAANPRALRAGTAERGDQGGNNSPKSEWAAAAPD
jgi:hypothetical protein